MGEVCAECRNVLVVEDEESLRLPLVDYLADRGARVTAAARGDEAIDLLTRHTYDLVLTDIRLPGADGFKVLERARQLSPSTCVVVMTAFADVDSAVRAIRAGAYDYLPKPFSFRHIDTVLLRTCRQRKLLREWSDLRSDERRAFKVSDIVSCSTGMQQALDIVRRVAPTDTSVVLQGETGTGKELFAEALHRLSGRADKRLVKLNCAAVPDTLIESELFGHERGAFTGATARKLGRFEVADGGTLFLDEIADLSAAGQAKLLRVLQDRTFERVGGVDTLTVDVRFIAATHRDLREEVAEGRFREDLYYRIGVITMRIPPLRERTADIPALIKRLLRGVARRQHRSVPHVAEEVVASLTAYPFPGNVRELRNLVERAATLCEGDELLPRHFPAEVMGYEPGRAAVDPDLPFPPLADATARFEAAHIAAALRRTGGRKGEAARLLGMSRKTLWHRLREPDDGSEG